MTINNARWIPIFVQLWFRGFDVSVYKAYILFVIRLKFGIVIPCANETHDNWYQPKVWSHSIVDNNALPFDACVTVSVKSVDVEVCVFAEVDVLDVLVFKGVLYVTVAGDVSVLIIFMNVVVINCLTGIGVIIDVLAATVVGGRSIKKNR